MSNSPNDVAARIMNTKLFNPSTHYYKLEVQASKFEFDTNEESKDFNEWFHLPVGTQFEGVTAETVFCLGNQHPAATVRDLIGVIRRGKLDEQTLREYSMFTIGDHVIITTEETIVAVNGDITRKPRTEPFTLTVGKK